MSFDSIIARSPSIIYRPGGVVGGLVVTTWTQVQQFIAERQGTVIVYIDNSIAAAHVPAASGVTDCQSRVELRAYRQNDVAPTTLTVDSGATLKALLKVAGTLQIFCNTLGATPALDFDYSGGAEPVLFLEDGASVAATGTNPSCVVPGASQLAIGLQESASVFANGAVPLFQVPAGSQLDFFATNSIIGDGVAAGAGNVFLFYDTATVTLGGGNTPALPAITGSYGAKLLDPSAIIYKPGAPSFGRTVATWPEVQAFISNLQGTGTVYVDDSIVTPALVPGATGVTNCQGRVTIEPFLADAVRFTVLQIEPGATLQDLAKVNAMELRCNPQNATRSLTFTSTNGGFLFISDGGMISNAATATQPAFDAPVGMFTTLDITGESLLLLNAPAVPLVAVAGEFNLFAFDAVTIANGFASGPIGATVAFLYDNSSANAFPTPGTPPTLPGFAGTYIQTNTDNIWAQKQIDPTTFNAPALNAVPVFDGTKWVATASPPPPVGGVPFASAYYDAAGVLSSDPSFLADKLDAFSRFGIHDFRLGPGGRGVAYRLGAWSQDGDPTDVVSEGYVTYGTNALGNGPSGTAGGLGFYTPNSFGTLQVIPGVNGGNPFYSCGWEDGGPTAPFGLDGFIVNDNLDQPIAWIKRTDNTSNFRTVTVGFGANKAVWSPGNGNPNGVVIGSPGDIYSNSAGGTGTTFWVKESGVATNTGWVSFNGPITGTPNTVAYFNGAGVLTETPAFLTAIDATGFFLVGATATDNGSAARVQNSSIIANASQFRSNQYGNNNAAPGLSTFKSRGAAIGTLVGLQAGDPISRWTTVGVAPDNASIPLSSFVTIQVPANFVPAGQNWLPSELEVQLVPLAGPINSRRPVFKITSEGETDTLRGIRAGGPSTLPTNLTTGTLWSSDAVNPNGTIVGSPGDLFSDTTGGAGATLWVKESGVATNTGWVAAGSTAPLVGNTNGPASANRFAALTLLGNDADVNVIDTAGWYWVRMTGLTANRSVVLPAAPTNGMVIVVKDGSGSLGAGFTITVNGNGNTIDGAATFVMTAANPGSKGAIQLQFDSAAPSPGWYLF